MRGLSPSTQSAIALLGSTLVAAGAMFPWLKIDPTHEGATSLVGLPGMGSGLELWGLVLVPAVLLLGVLHGLSSRQAADAVTLIVGGLALVLLTLYWQRYVYDYYVPAVGWYLTLTGALVLTVGGLERVWSRFGRRQVETDDPRVV